MTMKYIKQPDGIYVGFDEKSESYTLLAGLAKTQRPVFLAATDSGVKFFLAAQAEAANLAQDKAIEREAIDEVIREQFSKQIAERIKEKQEALTNRQNAK
jgi:2-phosphoglycerate kinase